MLLRFNHIKYHESVLFSRYMILWKLVKAMLACPFLRSSILELVQVMI